METTRGLRKRAVCMVTQRHVALSTELRFCCEVRMKSLKELLPYPVTMTCQKALLPTMHNEVSLQTRTHP